VTRESQGGTGDKHGEPGYDPAAYGDRLGSDYDALYPQEGLATDAAVDFLTDLTDSLPGNSLLEFGIGTGRLAVELDRRGLRVAGIEASKKMVAELRRKAPAARIEVTLGDYASARLSRRFSVVALVFNNILDPRGISAQLDIFKNAARHLVHGGCFVVEAFVLHDDAKNGSWTVIPRLGDCGYGR